jgi:ribokinase
MARIVVVGSYNQDQVWSCDELPVPGATRLGRYASGPGGKGFNQAVAARRAGADTVFITALGRDAAADSARALADADGILLRAQVDETQPSGTAGIFVDARGRNVIVVAPGANTLLSPAFIEESAQAFESAGVVLAQLEVAADAVLSALQAGRRAGAITILNPAPANAATTPALIAASDLLTPNETEFVAMLARHAGITADADSLAGLPDGELHALCRTLAPAATLVLTLGAGGVFVSHIEGELRGDELACYRKPAIEVQAVDTTGAGDAFNGALAAALAAGSGFADAIGFACRYAGLSTQQAGAASSMPHLKAPGDRA